MASIPVSRIARRSWTSVQSDLVFPFLSPSVQYTRGTSHIPISRFSTSPSLWKRDNNRNRGVSAIRRTGPRPRQTLSVLKHELPKPVLDPKEKTKIEGDEDHGLWGFFHKDKKLLAAPGEDNAYGRAWTVNELRVKSWDDLHCLWWVCMRERNRLATEKIERNRIKAGFGDVEAEARDKTVRKTMIAIQHTLTERWYAWEEARKVAKDDREVDLSGDGPAYTPSVISVGTLSY
ncbi:MRP-L47-domain-containing protein [Zopfia rhizophila CBS 207.26]|uniref:Large ribosomal subunit protein uL29m n=1 Tax=Zopfia rhizophila CBS 207.26 TaxID=1314779 RepID=A0A6A6DM05_9PEZI|nr:MRP-L47-domain-containing protein [Zopfia rhizophila CBS 207.26]